MGVFRSSKCFDVNEWEGFSIPSNFFRGLWFRSRARSVGFEVVVRSLMNLIAFITARWEYYEG
jgi:hypothetical protein